MRTQLVSGLLLLALTTSTAHADDHLWEGIFVGSVGVAFGGGALLWHGARTIDHAEENLCTGAYADSCDHRLPTDPATLRHYNDRGESGQTQVQAGAVMVIAGGALGLFAAYKAFIAKSEPAATESKMTFAPTVTREGAGATFQLRW